MRRAVGVFVCFCLALFVMSMPWVRGQASPGPIWPAIGPYDSVTSLSTAFPAGNVLPGTLGIVSTTPAALYYSDGVNWNNIYPRFSTVTTAIGGSLLALGSCTTQDVTVTGATISMFAGTSPQTAQPNGVQWQAEVVSANTVRVFVCGLIAVTPASSIYNVKVFPI